MCIILPSKDWRLSYSVEIYIIIYVYQLTVKRFASLILGTNLYNYIHKIVISDKIAKYFDGNFYNNLSYVLFKNMKFVYTEFISNTKTLSSCWVTEK